MHDRRHTELGGGKSTKHPGLRTVGVYDLRIEIAQDFFESIVTHTITIGTDIPPQGPNRDIRNVTFCRIFQQAPPRVPTVAP